MIPFGWFVLNVLGAGTAAYAGSKVGEGETVEHVNVPTRQPPIASIDTPVPTGYLVAGVVVVGVVAAYIVKRG